MARVLRRVAATALVACVALGLAGIVADVALVGRLDRIEGAFDGLGDRPPDAPGRTFLMVGTRPGTDGGPDVPWLPGEQSVESVALVDVAADGLSARVATMPDRSGVAPEAASPAPRDTVRAVEDWSGRRVDHVIAIDWDTFTRLAEHDGVETSYAWGSGPRAQQQFLQEVMDRVLHQELRKRPLDLLRVLGTTADGTAVDAGWSVLELDRLVLSLRNLRSHAITYETAQPA